MLGGIGYEVYGDSFDRLYRLIIGKNIPVEGLCERGGTLTFRLSAEHCLRAERAMRKLGHEFRRTEKYGLVRTLSFFAGRPGLLVGTALSCGLMWYYSDVILIVDVQTENDAIREQVMNVLEDRGIIPGKYIPDIDYAVEERALKKNIDLISWAGISRTGSGISVDVVENIPAEKGIHTGMPCDLVACEDGVIEKIELYEGQLMIPLGSGVVKGDTIVSGTVTTEKSAFTTEGEVKTSRTDYVKSVGKIYGTFTRKMVFRQDFGSMEKTETGRRETLHSLKVFSAEIPLYFQVPEGFFDAELSVKSPVVNGFTMPFALNEVTLTEFDYRPSVLTEEEALDMAGEKAYIYEQDFLKDHRLIDRQTKIRTDKNGVELEVSYTLYGLMSREREFFAPRTRPEEYPPKAGE